MVKIHQFVLKILSGNDILTSIKGHNCVRNLCKLTCNKPNTRLDLVNINVYTKRNQIPSIRSQDIERKLRRNHGMTDNLKTVYPRPIIRMLGYNTPTEEFVEADDMNISTNIQLYPPDSFSGVDFFRKCSISVAITTNQIQRFGQK